MLMEGHQGNVEHKRKGGHRENVEHKRKGERREKKGRRREGGHVMLILALVLVPVEDFQGMKGRRQLGMAEGFQGN